MQLRLKQIIREILEGNFKYDNTSLDFSCQSVELTVRVGETVEGSFAIYGAEGVLTEGYVVSSDLRMECLTVSFGGSLDEIFYRFDATHARAGEEVKGAFHIVSNQGESYLPFSVSIKAALIESSLGNIKNLFHFTNLAKTSWEEAVNLFYHKEFARIFTGNDRQYYTTYKGLSQVYGNEHNVEEFLLEINKKKPVEFIPEEAQIKIENPVPLARYTLVVHRNGWGYTHLRIETDGDFLSINEKEITDDGFVGNLYRLFYYIQDDKLHDGNNYGYIRLISLEQEITIPVTVIRQVTDRRRLFGSYREKKRVTMQLMQYYQAFRLKKIGAKTWMDETGKLIERLKEIDGNDIEPRMFQAQLFMSQERYHEAAWILEQDKEAIEAMQDENPALWCYYLYLTTLGSKSESYVDGVARTISTYYERYRGNWRIAWLLLFIAEEYAHVPARKWALLEELFMYKCHSPMVYIEAWNLICMNPAMLRSLGEFELQVLNYAVKNEAMKDDVILQLLYLSQKQKNFSALLLRILIACYEKKEQNDILQEICTTLIKGNLYGREYFNWYQKGVEQNLRITRLYEYYMMSVTLDDRQTLPKMVLMYFSYQSDLNYEITAWLYAYVWKHQEEIPDIYVNYIPAIEQFVVEQIKRGKINRHLAYLYRNVITQSMVTEEVAKALMELLFIREIKIESDVVKQVILAYPYATHQETYPVSNRCALVPIYDEECKVVLEDDGHNRYTKSIVCYKDHLIKTGKLTQMAAPYIREHLGYDLHICFDHKDMIAVQEENVDRFRRLADSDFITEEYRQEIRSKLLQFYYEKDRMWELDEYLFSLRPEEIAADDRKEAVRIMVLRGMYTEAYEWLRLIGPYNVEVKTLLKLCGRLLSQKEWEEDELMTGILYYILRKGKYNEEVLRYMVRFYNGSIKDMRDIWKAAVDFGVDVYELSERMIVQMLYTGSYIGEEMDVFSAYQKDGGKEEIICAFLSQCCYDYVIKEKVTAPFLMQSILRMYKEKIRLHLVCKIAWLKYYAENPEEITEEIKGIIRVFIKEMMEQQIILPQFKEYQGYLPALDMLQDKSILEYRAVPGHRATIYYLLEQDGDDGTEYCKEPMEDMFAGICVKEFILFFGERLQYYIKEDTKTGEQLTQSGTISRSDSNATAQTGSRFGLLNDIMIGKTLQDYDTVDHLLEEYYRKDFMVEKLFTPM